MAASGTIRKRSTVNRLLPRRHGLKLREGMAAMPTEFGGGGIHMTTPGDAALYKTGLGWQWRCGKGAPLRRGHSRWFRGKESECPSEAACDPGDDPTGEYDGGDDHHTGEKEPANKNFGHRLLQN